MSIFTRVGLGFVGVFCLMVNLAGADHWESSRKESVSYLETGWSVQTFDEATNTGTFRTSYSGSNNSLGTYTCTTGGSLRLDASGSCGPDAIGYVAYYRDAECSAEAVVYHYTVRVESSLICVPLQCFSPDPPHLPVPGCSYNSSFTGTVEGGDGITTGIAGSIETENTFTFAWVEKNGTITKSRSDATAEGIADLEFLEEEEPNRGASLEIPAPGSTVNGVGLISGWSCLGGELKAEIIDAGEVVDTVVLNHGSSRTDTEDACGDIHNGFSATVNWNHYAQGAKTIRLIRNGEEAESNEFSVLRLSEYKFLTGASGTAVVENFPTEGQETVIEWDESRQGFFPTEVRDSQ